MFGVVVGRLINRIADASYELDGKRHKLSPNDDHGSALHGGAGPGWAHRRWDLASSTRDSATYALRSPDGDQRFPGALDVSVTYLLRNDSLRMTMVVAADEANREATPVNIAQHSYFNLDGHAAGPRAIKQLRTTIDATHRAVLRADGTALPTGAVEPVAGGPFDFHSPAKAGRALGDSWNATTDPEPGLGYEVMFVTGNKTLAQAKGSTTRPTKLDKGPSPTRGAPAPVGCSVTKDGSPIRAARFESPCSGRTLEAWTSAPAFEIYTGNHLDPKGLFGKGWFSFFFVEREGGGEREKREVRERRRKRKQNLTFFDFPIKKLETGNHEYEQGGGIALEAQDFTDFLHHPDFPSCVLEPGQAMTRVFELRWGSVEKKKDGASSCDVKKKAAAVTAAGSDKSAVGAEEMMM
jgi:galactose mutarotase-like enzyme